MDFSEARRARWPAVKLSHDSCKIAAAVDNTVTVWDTENFKTVHMFSCKDNVGNLEWSGASDYLLAGLHKRGVVQVWRIGDDRWSCTIDQGAAGLANCFWLGGTYSVVMVADFGIRLTIWSLTDRSCKHFSGSKFCNRGVAINPVDNTLAVLERQEGKEWVSFINAEKGAKSSCVVLDSSDAADLVWSPNGQHLAVLGSSLEHRIAILDRAGKLCCSWHHPIDGLGVAAAAWSPLATTIGIVSYSKVLIFLSGIDWKSRTEVKHEELLLSLKRAVVYREVFVPGEAAAAHSGGLGQSVAARFVVDAAELSSLAATELSDEAGPSQG